MRSTSTAERGIAQAKAVAARPGSLVYPEGNVTAASPAGAAPIAAPQLALANRLASTPTQERGSLLVETEVLVLAGRGFPS